MTGFYMKRKTGLKWVYGKFERKKKVSQICNASWPRSNFVQDLNIKFSNKNTHSCGILEFYKTLISFY